MASLRLARQGASRFAARLCRSAVVAVAFAALVERAWADVQPKTAWLTGRALQQQLSAVVPRVFWSGVPLRQVVRSVSTSQRVAVLLDRRADPDHALDFALNDVTVEALLRRIAEDCGLGVTMVGPVTYLGPPDVAARLRTIALVRKEEAEKLPPDSARAFLQLEPLAWDDFAQPRDILRGLAAASGIEITGLEQVPHDLWGAVDLPPLTFVDRVTLIAAQFDLTFRVVRDGQAVDLVPIPEDMAIVRRYPGGKNPEQLAEQWSTLVPEAQVKVLGRDVYVRGLLEDHERLSGGPRPSPRRAAERTSRRGPPETRYTANGAKRPLDRVLRELAERLQVKVKIDEKSLRQAGISPGQLVSFSVKDATIDELFRAVLAPAGCTFHRTGNVIEVVPQK
jgi:hypothetical protein